MKQFKKLILTLRKKKKNEIINDVCDSSQLGESKIIAFIFECLNKQNFVLPKTFIEIGGNHPLDLSTSWYLEKALGFKGISIEPLGNYADAFSKLRSNTTLITKALVPNSYKDELVIFFESNCNVLSTIDEQEVEKMRKMGYSFKKKYAQTIKCCDLERHFKERIGVMIIDIESPRIQIEILRDIIKTNLKPHIICVETLEFSPNSKSLRGDFDALFSGEYSFIAGTYLNSIYLSNT